MRVTEDDLLEEIKVLSEKLEVAISEIESLTNDICSHPDYSCIDTFEAEKIREKYGMKKVNQFF